MDKTYLGRRLADFSPGIASKPITKVELLDEDGDVVGVSESGTGRTLTALQPDGTDAMAAAILAKVSGYKHIGYEGRKALLDPAVELGDAVTVDGLYVPLIALDMTFDPMLAPDISAPDADELDDEYPYKSPTQRQIERNMAKTRSLITKTSKEITLKVEGIGDKYTELKTTLDGVTITDESGTTRIKGSSIETTTLKVDAANITGSLTIGQLPSGVAQTSQIPKLVSQLDNDSGYQTKTGVTQIIGGTVTADYIYSLGIEANSVRGAEVAIKNGNGVSVGGITTTWTESGSEGIAITSKEGLKIGARTNLFLSAGSGGTITLKDGNMIMSRLALCLSAASYGPGAPSGVGVAGQIYVQLRQ